MFLGGKAAFRLYFSASNLLTYCSNRETIYWRCSTLICCSPLYDEIITLCVDLGELDAAIAIVADLETTGITVPDETLDKVISARQNENSTNNDAPPSWFWFVIIFLVWLVWFQNQICSFHGCKSKVEIPCSAGVNYQEIATYKLTTIEACKSQRGRAHYFFC